MPHTPLSRYQDDLNKPDFEADPAQQLAVEKLQHLYDELLAYQAPSIP
ncbi:MAG: cell division protein ZapE, partial [Arenicella sp.]